MPRSKKTIKSRQAKAGNSMKSVEARRNRFIEAFIANGENATRAAVAAGYSPKSAERQGLRLTSQVRIREEIDRRRGELLNKFELTTENVLKELARITFFDPAKCFDEKGNLLPVQKIDEDTRRALAMIKDGEVRPFNKPEALGKAMAHLKLLPGTNINVAATAQSLAANIPESEHNWLDIARRMAFLLEMGANQNGVVKRKSRA